MYLSAGSLAVEIVSAKSSEMNVVIPSGDDFVSYFVGDPSNSGKLHGFSESTYISLFLVFLKDLFFLSICLYVCTSYMFVIASGFLFYRP